MPAFPPPLPPIHPSLAFTVAPHCSASSPSVLWQCAGYDNVARPNLARIWGGRGSRLVLGPPKIFRRVF